MLKTTKFEVAKFALDGDTLFYTPFGKIDWGDNKLRVELLDCMVREKRMPNLNGSNSEADSSRFMSRTRIVANI